MPKVVIALADGFEEVEAISIVDVLRRAEVEVVLAGLHDGPVVSARKVKVIPDRNIDSVRADDYDMIVLPGGQPGSDNLNADERVKRLVKEFYQKGKIVGAICAAPYVLADTGIIEGKKVTSYPTYRERLGDVVYQEEIVVEDGNVLTSRGPGTALCFGLAIVERLVGREKAQTIQESMLLRKCCDQQ